MTRGPRAAILLGLLVGALSCGDSGVPGGPTPIVPTPTEGVLVGAGDIADCSNTGPDLTAELLDAIPGTVFTTGDNAYPHGSVGDYMRCYEPTWGRHKARTRPSPGNHEYETPGAISYFGYFGGNAGPEALGYYGFTVGQWLVVSLNSNIDASAGSPQAGWLRNTLQGFTGRCVAAIWHHPLLASGPNGPSPHMTEIWRILFEAGADLVLNGHEHLYERFGPLDAQARPTSRGMRLIVVGTGGAPLSTVRLVRPGSEVQLSTWGVLKLTLRPDAYDWEFIPVAGSSGRDQGRDVCR